MYQFNGRYVYLEELTTENDRELFEMIKNNEKEYRFYVSDAPLPQSYEEFQQTLETWFSHGRNFQFLVYTKRDKKLIGTIFFYGWNKENQTTKISAFFIPEYRKTIYIGEALGAAVLFAKEIMQVKELHFDCYLENEQMIELAKKIGAKEIGIGKSKVNPNREIISFKIPEEKLDELVKKIKYFESEKLEDDKLILN